MRARLRRLYHLELQVGPLLVLYFGLKLAFWVTDKAGDYIREDRLLPAFALFVAALAIYTAALMVAAPNLWRRRATSSPRRRPAAG